MIGDVGPEWVRRAPGSTVDPGRPRAPGRGPSPCVMVGASGARATASGYARFSAWRRATYAAAWERRSMPSFESRLET